MKAHHLKRLLGKKDPPLAINMIYDRSPRVRERDSIANYIRDLLVSSEGRPICCWGPDDRPEELDLALPPNVIYKAVFHRGARAGSIPQRFLPAIVALARQFDEEYKRDRTGGIFWLHYWDYGWAALREPRNCVILTDHGVAGNIGKIHGKHPVKYLYHVVVERAFVKRANLVIPVSEEGHAHLWKILDPDSQAKVKFLPTFVDTDVFKPDDEVRRQAKKNGEGPVILFAGRLTPAKALDKAIDAFKCLSAIYPQAVFRIVGSGELLMPLQMQARGLSQVVFVGNVPHDQMIKEYQAADLLLLLSEREGTPLALLESLACGTPAVTSGVGGMGAVMEAGKNGFVVDPRNPVHVVQAIEQVLGLGDPLRKTTWESGQRFGRDVVVPKIWDTVDAAVERWGRR